MESGSDIVMAMKGRPLPEITQELWERVNKAGIDVPMEQHLIAMSAALLEAVGELTTLVHMAARAAGLDSRPDIAGELMTQRILLRAQVQIYDVAFGTGVEVVDGEVEAEAVGTEADTAEPDPA